MTTSYIVWTVLIKEAGFYGVSKIETDHYLDEDAALSAIGMHEAQMQSLGFRNVRDGVWKFMQRTVTIELTSQRTTPLPIAGGTK